jgi:hypothetical protein
MKIVRNLLIIFGRLLSFIFFFFIHHKFLFDRIRCAKLHSFVLSDGEYYELVRSNFERADRQRVVRTTTSDQTSIVSLLDYFNDLRFN